MPPHPSQQWLRGAQANAGTAARCAVDGGGVEASKAGIGDAGALAGAARGTPRAGATKWAADPLTIGAAGAPAGRERRHGRRRRCGKGRRWGRGAGDGVRRPCVDLGGLRHGASRPPVALAMWGTGLWGVWPGAGRIGRGRRTGDALQALAAPLAVSRRCALDQTDRTPAMLARSLAAASSAARRAATAASGSVSAAARASAAASAARFASTEAEDKTVRITIAR